MEASSHSEIPSFLQNLLLHPQILEIHTHTYFMPRPSLQTQYSKQLFVLRMNAYLEKSLSSRAIKNQLLMFFSNKFQCDPCNQVSKHLLCAYCVLCPVPMRCFNIGILAFFLFPPYTHFSSVRDSALVKPILVLQAISTGKCSLENL